MLRDLWMVMTTRDQELAGETALELLAWWEETLGMRLLWRLLHPAYPPEEPRDDVVDWFGGDLGSICRDPWSVYSLRLHDAAHVDLGYDRSPRGEGELAAYMLANGIVDPGYVLTVTWAIRHGVPMRTLMRAALRGRREPSVMGRIL
jgi:hypothetical protein